LYWMGKQIDNAVTHLFWVRYYDGTKPHQITGEHVIDWQARRYRVMNSTNAGDAQRFTMIEAKDLGAVTAEPGADFIYTENGEPLFAEDWQELAA
jgi:hypothetical protein